MIVVGVGLEVYTVILGRFGVYKQERISSEIEMSKRFTRDMIILNVNICNNLNI